MAHPGLRGGAEAPVVGEARGRQLFDEPGPEGEHAEERVAGPRLPEAKDEAVSRDAHQRALAAGAGRLDEHPRLGAPVTDVDPCVRPRHVELVVPRDLVARRVGEQRAVLREDLDPRPGEEPLDAREPAPDGHGPRRRRLGRGLAGGASPLAPSACPSRVVGGPGCRGLDDCAGPTALRLIPRGRARGRRCRGLAVRACHTPPAAGRRGGRDGRGLGTWAGSAGLARLATGRDGGPDGRVVPWLPLLDPRRGRGSRLGRGRGGGEQDEGRGEGGQALHRSFIGGGVAKVGAATSARASNGGRSSGSRVAPDRSSAAWSGARSTARGARAFTGPPATARSQKRGLRRAPAGRRAAGPPGLQRGPGSGRSGRGPAGTAPSPP